MYSFQELKKNSKKDLSEYPAIRAAVLGDCSTQFLSVALRGCGALEGLDLQVFDMPYDQIQSQTLDERSELYQCAPEYIVIQMCVERLYERFCMVPVSQKAEFAEIAIKQIICCWEQISRYSRARILQFDFAELDDNVFGSYGSITVASFRYQLRRLGQLLSDEAIKHQNVYILPLSSIQNRMGRTAFYDPKLYYSAKMPLSMQALPYAAKQAVDMILALRGKIKKCIILDLDNTLWGGVVGDDGLGGIQLGELGAGHAYTVFQRWLKELKNRGILLAVCSKNEEKQAKEPFLKHPDMVLRLDDIAIFVANWEDKANNIKRIQQTLGLGMDSCVFLDDSAFERNLVRELIPEITVPELPEDPAEYLEYLQFLNLFETASFSDEDVGRTGQYQAEAKRKEMQSHYDSIEKYLSSLEMVSEVGRFDEFHLPRIAQLTQRSNQFNLRSVRYTQEELHQIATDDSYITLYFTLKDKLGDYGLVSVVILMKMETTLFVDTWLMSCRVLNRGLEEFVMNQIVLIARNCGFQSITGEYLKTPKNAMVSSIYTKFGFERMNDTLFRVDLDSFSTLKTFVKGG